MIDEMREIESRVKFTGYKVEEINYFLVDPEEEEVVNAALEDIGLKAEAMFSPEEYKGMLKLTSSFYDENIGRVIKVSLSGAFEFSREIEEDYYRSFLRNEAVDLLYPYVRSITSNLTSLDSSDAILLPLINSKK